MIEILLETRSRCLARLETCKESFFNVSLIISRSSVSLDKVVELPIDFNSLCLALILPKSIPFATVKIN